MFSPDDTIVAIATPPGRGGLGVVRISGPRALEIPRQLTGHAAPFEPRLATFTRLRGSEHDIAAVGDELVVTMFPAPHSYTGQDVAELSAHGSPVVLDAIVQRAMALGARLAEPGEFTLRAFLNGKRDLVQAEAVADLIEAATPLQARTAFDQLQGTLTRRITTIDETAFDLIARLEASLDFPDEGYHFVEGEAVGERIAGIIEEIDRLLGDAARGRLIREGATVVIAGRPNVGKSSLFNALVGAERAIVTSIAGTTRDLVTERVSLHGIPLTLVDTAGARDAQDPIEREGVARGTQARTVADAVIVVIDRSAPIADEDERLVHDTTATPRLIVANKRDRAAEPGALPWLAQHRHVTISATNGDGIDQLRSSLVQLLTGAESRREPATLSNVRHAALLEQARSHLAAARQAAQARAPEEFVLADLQAARGCFDEVVGRRASEDILRHIFERFCIGK